MSEYDDIINDPNYTYGLDHAAENPQSSDKFAPPVSALAKLPPSIDGGQANETSLREITTDQKKILQKLYKQSRYADPHQINLAVHQIEHAIETSDPSKPLPVPLQATLNAINELGIGGLRLQDDDGHARLSFDGRTKRQMQRFPSLAIF